MCTCVGWPPQCPESSGIRVLINKLTLPVTVCMQIIMCIYSLQYTLLCPGILLTLLIIEFLGRKKTMAVEFIVCMAGFLLLYICTVL